MAIAGGLVVSLLLVLLVEVLSPAEELEQDRVTVTYDAFQFTQSSGLATVGTQLRVVNDGGVPIEVNVTGPGDATVRFNLEPGTMANLTMDEKGTYLLTASPYDWSATSVTVRTSNPITRFFEDLF